MAMTPAQRARLERLMEQESEWVIDMILASVDAFLNWLRKKSLALWNDLGNWISRTWASFKGLFS